MASTKKFMAVDLGASSGRVLVGHWDGEKFGLEELHRFANGYISILGRLHWDVLHIWEEIIAGLRSYSSKCQDPLAGISVNAWGVDFASLDRSGQLLGNPFHYRDTRTQGILEKAFARVRRDEFFLQTGIQCMPINTLFQLFSMAESHDPRLEMCDRMLMIPDLFHFWLSGEKATELTAASTTQMLKYPGGQWAVSLLARLGIPTHFLSSIISPGKIVCDIQPEILAETKSRGNVPVIIGASHDTASAVAAIPGMGPDSAFVSCGTWSLMGMEMAEAIVDEKTMALNLTNEAGAEGKTLLMRNIPGLLILQECLRQWQHEGYCCDWGEVLKLAEEAKPFQSLLDLEAPEFLTPGDMPAVIKNYCRRTHQRVPENIGEIARCGLESLSLKYRNVLEALETVTMQKIDAVRLVGGGSRNSLLCQFTANACKRLVVSGPVEATTLGNVMIQAITTGHLKDISEGRERVQASVTQQTYEPLDSDAWDAAYSRFCELLSPHRSLN
jgi:rhamnulokinase